MSNSFYSLKVKELIKESINAVSVVFEIAEDMKAAFSYKAGQYLTLKTTVSGEEIRRAYSLSSCPETDSDLKVSVKKVEGGKMSTYLCESLKVGDELDVMVPQGTFVNEGAKEKLVLFAAGSGITPIISILKSELNKGNQKISLFYGNRSEEETMFKAELEALANSSSLDVSFFYSKDSSRLDASKVKNLVNANDNADYFICGPEGMIAATKEGLESASIDSKAIHIEYFGSPKTEKPKTEAVVSGEVNEVTLILDGESHQVTLNPQETILEAGERIGIDPPFSCQSGVCTTCMAKVMQGEVEMENNFGLGEDEVEDGFVLTCICTPKTAGVVISWDED
jgi:ring-1,2-phenylacetyl-CoA epoxidase subunit PaaE